MGSEQSQERKNSTEVADFDFRGSGRLEVEVEEEARDCFSWQHQQNQGGWREGGWGGLEAEVKRRRHST